ncbi:hypothetical protein HanIR_Chr12g0575341 [Helianthus annuus]|nr:hypothetical protein HanIR_Chr12g0575341 [Helianthus annuus]
MLKTQTCQVDLWFNTTGLICYIVIGLVNGMDWYVLSVVIELRQIWSAVIFVRVGIVISQGVQSYVLFLVGLKCKLDFCRI